MYLEKRTGKSLRKLPVLCIVAALSCSLFAADLTATGMGASREEARANAKIELSLMVRQHVTSVEILTSSDVAETESPSDEYSSYTNISDDKILYGVLIEDLPNIGSQYRALATIPVSALLQYKIALDTVKNEIESIEETIPTAGEDEEISTLLLIDAYDRFELYRDIALRLDPETEIPFLKKTKMDAQIRYLSILKAKESTLQSEADRLGQAAKAEQSKLVLLNINKELQENHLKQKQLMEAISKRQVNKLQETRRQLAVESRLMEAETAIVRTDDRVSPDTAAQMIDQIEQTKATYQSLLDSLNEQIRLAELSIEEVFSEQETALQNKPFRTGEMVDGNPTDEAIAHRTEDLEEIRAKRDFEIAEATDRLKAAMQDQLDSLKSSITEECSVLESTTFHAYTKTGEITYEIGTYDGEKKAWPIEVEAVLPAGNTFSFDTYLPYELLVEEMEKQDWETYLNGVELYDTFFNSENQPLEMELSYTIKIGAPSAYLVLPLNLYVSRIDTGELILIEQVEHDNPAAAGRDDSDHREAPPPIRHLVEKRKNMNFSDVMYLYRQGLYFNWGTAYPTGLQELTDQMTDASAQQLSAYYTFLPFWYGGISLESTDLNQDEETLQSLERFSVLTGVVYPFEISDNFVCKPFLDLRCSFADETVAIVNGGVELRWDLDGAQVAVEFAAERQLTGTGAGSWSKTVGINGTLLFGLVGAGISLLVGLL